MRICESFQTVKWNILNNKFVLCIGSMTIDAFATPLYSRKKSVLEKFHIEPPHPLYHCILACVEIIVSLPSKTHLSWMGKDKSRIRWGEVGTALYGR